MASSGDGASSILRTRLSASSQASSATVRGSIVACSAATLVPRVGVLERTGRPTTGRVGEEHRGPPQSAKPGAPTACSVDP